MKRVIFITGLILSVLITQAKSWEMTYKSHGLIADETNRMKLTKFVNPGFGGSDQIWDFTELQITKNFEGYINNSVYEKNYNELLNTNVVLKEFSNQFYFKGDKNSLELYGVAVNDKLYMKYDKPFIKMRYPFGYGDSFSGTYGGKYISGNLEGVIDGTYSVEADGYGTLLLPGDITIDNVLRVKTSRTYERTLNNTSHQISITTYRWYAEDIRFPLLVLIENKLINSNNKTSTSYRAAYRDDIINLSQTTALETNNINTTFNLYPNPLNDFANIEYSLSKNEKVSIIIYDIKGEKVQILLEENQDAGFYKHTINTSELNIAPGTYYLRLYRGNNISTKKFIIQ